MLMASKILSIVLMVQSSMNTWVHAIILPLSIAEKEVKAMLDPQNHNIMAMVTKYILYLIIINLLITILNLNTITHLQPIMKFLILVDFQLSTFPQDSEVVSKDQTMPTIPNINFNLFSLIIIVFLCIYNNHNNCHFSINFAQPAIKEMF